VETTMVLRVLLYFVLLVAVTAREWLTRAR
jgi:hypothetical protein